MTFAPSNPRKLRNKVRLIIGRVNHTQANGKKDKFFDIFEKDKILLIHI